ncbi:MAG: nuclear transport factor 2 family protein [Balneolaceae bacterium]|nr:nuclear transport factor 2 family protein [Balneolaceae bacterium]
MKYSIYLLGLLLICSACREADHTNINTDAIEQEILSMGSDVVQALNEANIDDLVRDFWQSDSTLFMINGMKVQGYESIMGVMEQIPNRRKDLDLKVEDEQVYVLSNNAAVHVVKFREVVTRLDDSISESEGVWNTVYKKMDDGWKIVMVHESHPRN